MTNYKFPRGDTRVMTVTVTKPATGVDLTNYDVWFSIKSDWSVADANAEVSKKKASGLSTAQGITVSSPVTLQQVTIQIDPADTAWAPLKRAGETRVHWDVQARNAAGETTTIDSGLILLQPDVTRA